jgi:molybdopterin-guanine dinucleotide biosynthesis protein MobB
MKHVCIVGASGSGKTTLVVKLVSYLSRRGVRVGTLKHSHHDFDMDRRGKDSQRHFAAGARVSGVLSPGRAALFYRGGTNLLLHFRGCDLLIIEGLRGERFPKLEVFRKAVTPLPLYQKERFKIRALITPDRVDFAGPRFRPNQVAKIAEFILKQL